MSLDDDSFYIGTYKTREAAEAGLSEKDATISRLENELHTARSQERDYRDALDMATKQQQAATVEDPKAVFTEQFMQREMPDPAEDPEAAKNWMKETLEGIPVIVQEQIDVAQQKQSQQMTAAQQAQETAKALEAKFIEQNPDLEKYMDVVAITAQNIQGYDPRRAIEFFPQIAEQSRARLGEMGVTLETKEELEAGRSDPSAETRPGGSAQPAGNGREATVGSFSPPVGGSAPSERSTEQDPSQRAVGQPAEDGIAAIQAKIAAQRGLAYDARRSAA